MTFSYWCRVVLSATPRNQKLAAQMHNIVAEDRIPEIEQVKNDISVDFAVRTPASIVAAEMSIQEAQKPLRDPNCALLGLIPSISENHRSFEAVSFVTGTQIERHIISTFRGRAPSMPRRVRLPTRLFARFPRRFLWATFQNEVERLTPTELAVSLGLPHFLEGETVYRIPLGDWPDAVYIPTCMDSGIFEAWMRPPKNHSSPWGTTRHLLDGRPDKPELLVQVADVEQRGLVAEQVGPQGAKVEAFDVDFLTGRDMSICEI